MKEEIKYPIRINRYLELTGLVTRREADELITAGFVLVNNRPAVLGYKLKAEDQVAIKNNSPLSKRQYSYFAFNKPRGLTTHSAVAGEPDVVSLIKKKLPTGRGKIFPIGRLDKDSEGLLLLTNDGRITDRLLNPKFSRERVYEVETREKVSPMHRKILEGGVIFRAGKQRLNLKAKKVEILDSNLLRITLTEGKKHEVRRLLNGARLTITKLKRVSIANIRLGQLSAGAYRELKGQELKEFLAMLY